MQCLLHAATFACVYLATRIVGGNATEAANAVTTVNTLQTIHSTIINLNTFNLKSAMEATYSILTYFSMDIVHIICTNLRNEWFYIPHHMIAIFIGICILKNYVSYKLIGNYILYIEVSNIFLPLWAITRERYSKIRNFIMLLLSLTYLPTRGILLPLLTVPLLRDAVSKPMPLSLMLTLGYSAILIMSLMFCIRIIRILRYRLNSNLTVILSTSNDRWFPIITYLIKAYINWYVFAHRLFKLHNPFIFYSVAGLLLLDSIHIPVSWMFYLTQYAPIWEKLDFSFIHAKIWSTGIGMALISQIKVPLINFMVSGAAAGISIMTACKHGKIDIENNKKIIAIGYLINYIVSSNIFLQSDHPLAFPAALLYGVGGLLWVLGIPERFGGKIAFNLNSLGWMHVCVIISDIFVVQIANAIDSS